MPPKKKARTDTSSPAVVLCYGDSNTYGQSSDDTGRMPYDSRWTTELQRALGDGFIVVPEGLNGRTTVLDGPHESPLFSGPGGEGINGRRYLLPCLHSHSPIDVVGLALGCNDLKQRFNLEPCEIAMGLDTLIVECQRSGAGPDGGAPKLVILSPPACKETEVADSWGFRPGTAQRALATIEAYRQRAAEDGLPFVNLGAVADVGADGIHFPPEAAKPIGDAVARAVLGRVPAKI